MKSNHTGIRRTNTGAWAAIQTDQVKKFGTKRQMIVFLGTNDHYDEERPRRRYLQKFQEMLDTGMTRAEVISELTR